MSQANPNSLPWWLWLVVPVAALALAALTARMPPRWRAPAVVVSLALIAGAAALLWAIGTA